MDESREVIRLELEGNWSAEELGMTLVVLSDLYCLRLFLELLREDVRDWMRYFPEFRRGPSGSRSRSRRPLYPGPFPLWPNPPTLNDVELSRISHLIEPDERLELRRITYASPGFADLAGIGTVVGHVKDFILKLVERRDLRHSRELDDEHGSLENERLRIQNAREFVALAGDLGYTNIETRKLMLYVDEKQELILRLVEQRKLVNVSTPDEHEL